jgi:exodeoxyribonuclease V alpha subunit
LPHDAVIVDETSMVSLSMMARLAEAVREDARLILVGDPEQLASVEAGAVLGDVVGSSTSLMRMTSEAQSLLEEVTGDQFECIDPPLLDDGSASPIGNGIVVLQRVHRFGASIARLSEAIKHGDSQEAFEVLAADSDFDVQWVAVEPDDEFMAIDPDSVRGAAVSAGGLVLESAKNGEPERAIEALGSFRLLCAHRRGPAGASTWASKVEGWLYDELTDFDPQGAWYVGRPLLVTGNDYSLGLT